MVTKRIYLGDQEETLLMCGEQDANLKTLEKRLGVQIFARSSTLAIRGNIKKVDEAITALEGLRSKIHHNREAVLMPTYASERNVEGHFGQSKTIKVNYPQTPTLTDEKVILTTAFGKNIHAVTEQQQTYVDAIAQSDLTLGIGPAGTGKTFLAVACALREFHAGKVRRIVLTRPVVEAGEKLGFLPGDFYDKINPYLRPLYDAFQTFLGPERFRIYRDDETIEIVPLAYMRGRTLNNAFIILDEAQNTTPEQMKMFLTRMGGKSKMVVTGDVTQIDLEFQNRSGLIEALKILKNMPEAKIIQLTEVDIVRHELVRKIIQAYQTYETKKAKPPAEPPAH